MKPPVKDQKNARPIVIKKVKKVVKGGHHGGAWKVAYADFMTAMMAFFLLLWILSSPDQTKLEGLAQYFNDPAAVPLMNIGGEGVLEGSSIEQKGLYADQSHVVEQTSPKSDEEAVDPVTEQIADGAVSKNPWAELMERQDKFEEAVANGAAKFVSVEQQLELLKGRTSAFPESIIVEADKDSIRIEALDMGSAPLFQTGGKTLTPESAPVLAVLKDSIMSMDGLVHITGHTDAQPFAGNGDYSNWELSSDRAHAVRRALVELGVPEDRFARVAGAAETSPYLADEPMAETNRRVTIEIHPRENLFEDSPVQE